MSTAFNCWLSLLQLSPLHHDHWLPFPVLHTGKHYTHAHYNCKMQTFRRAHGVKSPDFWQEKMKGWEGSTPEGKNKVVVMLDRVDVPGHIARTCR